MFESQRLQIDIFLGGENPQEPLIQHGINKSAYSLVYQLTDRIDPLRPADSQNLPLTADHQNI